MVMSRRSVAHYIWIQLNFADNSDYRVSICFVRLKFQIKISGLKT